MNSCQSTSVQERDRARELFTNCIIARTFSDHEDLTHPLTCAEVIFRSFIMFNFSSVCVCVCVCVVSGEACFAGTSAKGCVWSSSAQGYDVLLQKVDVPTTSRISIDFASIISWHQVNSLCKNAFECSVPIEVILWFLLSKWSLHCSV